MTAEKDVVAVADVIAVAADVVVGEAGEMLPTQTKSGRRGTRIVVPKSRSLATAAVNLASYNPNAQSTTPERRTIQ